MLTVSCPDGPGIAHAITSFLIRFGSNISELQQFDDPGDSRFFSRILFSANAEASLRGLHDAFAPVAAEHRMTWTLHAAASPCRLLIMVSKYGHCLNDLLFRASTGALNVQVPLVVSNHPDLEPMCKSAGVDFELVPVTPATKANAESRLLELVEQLDVDLVVLARYMQILSDNTCAALAGRAINIHHSFLPSFKGAKPYHQAYARGVKQVGATAHYVTSDLDEGPIIEQEVIRVDHTYDADALLAAGRDAECQALAKAVRWHAEHRVLVNGSKTVVFR